MEYFQIYLLFAITTGITSIFELLLPVFKMQEEKTNKPIENRITMILATLAVNILIAPLIFLSCIIPSMGVRFRIAMQEGLFPSEEKI